jgi:ElaB/YqjD/DUF883 family membrane-anchored ribosome-binding protein
MASETITDRMSNNTKIWLGIAVGAAVGFGIALSRRSHGHSRKSRWDEVAQRIGESSSDFADAARDIADRVKTIYDESRRVVEDASAVWAHGRKLVSH